MKAIKTSIVLLLGLLLAMTFACGGSEQGANPIPPSGWGVYSNANYGISIQYPQNWELIEGLLGSVVMFKSPQISASDDFLENINIVVEDLSSQSMTLSEYVEYSIDMEQRYFTDYELIESSTTTLSNEPAQRVVFTGKQGIYSLKWMQILSVKNNVAYVITYTAMADSYSSELEIIQQMIDSFVIY